MAEGNPRRRRRVDLPIPEPAERPLNLRFGEDSAAEQRLARLWHKNFQDSHPLSLPEMRKLNLRGYFVRTLPFSWRNLLTIDHPQYRELVLEFFCTYRYTPGLPTDRPCIRFRLGGEQRRLSLVEFAIRMGIYPEDDIHPEIGRSVELTGEQCQALWGELTGGLFYDNRHAKATRIRSPRTRILHRISSTCFFSRLETAGNVNLKDLNLLYSFLHASYVCPARELADAFTYLHGRSGTQAIAGGAFITQLAISYDLDLSDAGGYHVVGRVLPLTCEVFRHMGLAVERDGEWQLIGGDAPAEAEPEPAQQPAAEEMQPETVGNIEEDWDLDISFTPSSFFTEAGPSQPPPAQSSPSTLRDLQNRMGALEVGMANLRDGFDRHVGEFERFRDQHMDFQHSMIAWNERIWTHLTGQPPPSDQPPQ